jgi:hypothetical protein
MKTKILLLAVLFFCFKGFSQTWQWTHPEKNSDPPDHHQAHDVEVDTLGNVYVLGNYADSLFLNDNFIAGGNGSYLAKYDSTGKLLWYKLIVCTDSSATFAIRATGLTVNSTGVYITGYYVPSNYGYDCNGTWSPISLNSYKIGSFNFSSSHSELGFFLAKLNSNGGVVWNKVVTAPPLCIDGTYYPGGMLLSNPIVTSDKKNNIISSFAFNARNTSSISIGGSVAPLRGGDLPWNPFYLVVTKFNGSGKMLWSNYAGGGFTFVPPNNYYGAVADCNSIVCDNNNNIFLLGTAGDSTYFGSQLFRHSGDFAGGYIPTFVSKISSTGVWQYVKELCNASDNTLSNTKGNPDLLAVDNQNNLYALLNVSYTGSPQIILGDTLPNPASPAYLVKIKNNGTQIWHKGFDNAEPYAKTNSICFSNNNLYIAGGVNQDAPAFGSLTVLRNTLSQGNTEYIVAKANTDGDFQWVASFGCLFNGDSYWSGAEGFAVKVFNDNIYTGGYYMEHISTLGNLDGNYTGGGNRFNIFFGKLKDQSIRVGTIAPSQVVAGCNVTIPFTSNGLTFSAGNTFTAELSDLNTNFTNPIVIGSTVSTGTGTIIATIPSNLPLNNVYRVRIHSSDTLKTGFPYYAYADTGFTLTIACPSAPSAGFKVTNITATSATLNWTGVDCAAGYRVQYRIKGTTAWTTVNIATNTPTLNISGLTANTTYQWRVATKCRNNGTVSFSSFSKIQQFTTAASFASNSSSGDNAITASGNGLKVYPNPANETAIVEFGTAKAGVYTLQVEDAAGRVLFTKHDVASAGKNTFQIDVSRFAQGMYEVTIIDDTGKQTTKLSKQ